MSIDGTKLSRWEQVYTFVSHDGYNITIHSPLLRKWVLASRHPITRCNITKATALQYIATNVVSLKRAMSMPEPDLWEPIILCKTEAFGLHHPTIPDALHVDGHHRYVRHALDGRTQCHCYMVEMRDWHQFRVYNLPNVSRNELIETPNLKRDYW